MKNNQKEKIKESDFTVLNDGEVYTYIQNKYIAFKDVQSITTKVIDKNGNPYDEYYYFSYEAQRDLKTLPVKMAMHGDCAQFAGFLSNENIDTNRFLCWLRDAISAATDDANHPEALLRVQTNRNANHPGVVLSGLYEVIMDANGYTPQNPLRSATECDYDEEGWYLLYNGVRMYFKVFIPDKWDGVAPLTCDVHLADGKPKNFCCFDQQKQKDLEKEFQAREEWQYGELIAFLKRKGFSIKKN